MKYLKYISVLVLTIMLTSCSSEKSIQQLYVDSETNDDYLMFDIPMSIMELPDSATLKAKQAYESVNKVNLLVFKINELNKDNYKVEKDKVKKIIKNPKYQELMRVNNNGYKIIAKYIGSDESIEELILFASDNKKGFGLARVLGDDMKPENMIVLLDQINNIDQESEIFNQLEGFFK